MAGRYFYGSVLDRPLCHQLLPLSLSFVHVSSLPWCGAPQDDREHHLFECH